MNLVFYKGYIQGAIAYDRIFTRSTRRTALLLFAALFFLCVMAALAAALLGYGAGMSNRILGGAILSGSAFLWFAAFEFYYRSISRAELFFGVPDSGGNRADYLINVRVAEAMECMQIPRSSRIALREMRLYLAGAEASRMVFMRLGVLSQELSAFANTAEIGGDVSAEEVCSLLASSATDRRSDTITLQDIMGVFFDLDPALQKFLLSKGLHRKELTGAAAWMESLYDIDDIRMRWWSADYLRTLPGIGVALGYGYTYTLDKYAHEVAAPQGVKTQQHRDVDTEALRALKDGLSRSLEANVVLVGEPGSGKHELLFDLARSIAENRVARPLRDKRLVLLDASALVAGAKTKGDFEALVIKLMNEAVSAGNIILVMENFPEFLDSASALGVDGASLLDPYLEGVAIQVVAIADPARYGRTIQTNTILTKLFEKVDVPEPSDEGVLYVLEDVARALERAQRLLFTYQSLVRAVELADRYIADGAMPEKAIDLLTKAAAKERLGEGYTLITPEDMEHAVEELTRIPVMKAGGKEAEKLLHLEEFLHKRVVGQKEALKAVAQALRKARAGLHAGKRPIGSFLFLGPTGVGKTETAKAVAEAYFGSDRTMKRFDMSEFQGADGLEKLTGSFAAREPGILANALREEPFTLLLLDEFEKSSREVVNLFLQIFEEGFFTDAFGKKVSARDTIIIATSNAGANRIWDVVRAGEDPASLREEIVNAIRQEGVFAPEILNRFDAIVIFHPLAKEHLVAIARLLLQDLAARLKEQDIVFTISEELVQKIAEIGYDPVMGARPMRRAIADKVEEVVSRKILEGALTRGSSFSFTPEEIVSL